MKGCGLSDWPNWPTFREVLKRNSCTANWRRKNSERIGPSQPRIEGNLRGVIRLTRNILIGCELLLNVSEPPSPGPHERLCLPKEICQLDAISPTYASKSLSWFTAG